MSISLRDLKMAKAALRAKCKLHGGAHGSASCEVCHGLAAGQQDKQWRRQREAAHLEYLNSFSTKGV